MHILFKIDMQEKYKNQKINIIKINLYWKILKYWRKNQEGYRKKIKWIELSMR